KFANRPGDLLKAEQVQEVAKQLGVSGDKVEEGVKQAIGWIAKTGSPAAVLAAAIAKAQKGMLPQQPGATTGKPPLPLTEPVSYEDLSVWLQAAAAESGGDEADFFGTLYDRVQQEMGGTKAKRKKPQRKLTKKELFSLFVDHAEG